MARTYSLNPGTRLINWVFRTMTRLGLGASYRQILTVPGRKTGRFYSTPVDVMEVDGDRWLVAGYGPVNWVLNARAAGEVTLGRGGRTDRYQVAEAAPAEAVPVLRKYLTEVRVIRPYFDAAPDAPYEDLEAELPRHAVLRLVRQADPAGRNQNARPAPDAPAG
jgi:deazaflavin-dependent oxidoreductase (nitroreductase family)